MKLFVHDGRNRSRIFHTVRGRTQKWAKLSLLYRWCEYVAGHHAIVLLSTCTLQGRRDEIGTGIEELKTQIEIQLEKFSVSLFGEFDYHLTCCIDAVRIGTRQRFPQNPMKWLI